MSFRVALKVLQIHRGGPPVQSEKPLIWEFDPYRPRRPGDPTTARDILVRLSSLFLRPCPIKAFAKAYITWAFSLKWDAQLSRF